MSSSSFLAFLYPKAVHISRHLVAHVIVMVLGVSHPNTVLISPQHVAHGFIIVVGVHHPPKAVHNHLATTRKEGDI